MMHAGGGRQDMHQNPGRTNRSTEAKAVERDTAGQGGNHPTRPPLTLSFKLLLLLVLLPSPPTPAIVALLCSVLGAAILLLAAALPVTSSPAPFILASILARFSLARLPSTSQSVSSASQSPSVCLSVYPGSWFRVLGPGIVSHPARPA